MNAAQVVEEFGLRAIIGLGCVVPLLRHHEVDPWYFRTQALVALGCAVVLALATGGVLPWLAVATAWLAFVFWTLGREWPGRGAFVLLAILGIMRLTTELARASQSLPLAALQEADYVLSSSFVAAVYCAMILGHWYLVWPWMSIEPLMRALWIAFGALGLRFMTWALQLTHVGLSVVVDRPVPLQLLAVQSGIGFLGGGLGLFLAWRCARIRSTQSATGILYAATVMVLLGELAGAQALQLLS